MRTTTDKFRPKSPSYLWVVLFSIAAQLVGVALFYYGPWRTKVMERSALSEQAQKMDEEAKARRKAEEEKRRKEREQRKLSKKDAKNLKREEEHKRARTLKKQIRELEKAQRELAELKERKLEEIKQRDVAPMVEQAIKELSKAFAELDRKLKPIEESHSPEVRNPIVEGQREFRKNLRLFREKPAHEAARALLEQPRKSWDETAREAHKAHREEFKRTKPTDHEWQWKNEGQRRAYEDQRKKVIKQLETIAKLDPERFNEDALAEAKENAPAEPETLDTRPPPPNETLDFATAQSTPEPDETDAPPGVHDPMDPERGDTPETLAPTDAAATTAMPEAVRDMLAQQAAQASALAQQTAQQAAPQSNPEATGQSQVADLHAQAAALQRQMQADFTAIRSAELANIQQTSLGEAVAATTAPQSAPLAFNPSAGQLENIETVGDMNDYRDQLNQAVKDVGNIARRTERMLGQARQMAGAPTPQNAQAAAQQSRQNIQLAAAARGEMGRGVDVSAFMRAQAQAQGSVGSVGGEGVNYRADAKPDDWSGEMAQSKTEPTVGKIKGSTSLPSHVVYRQALPGRKFTKTSSRKGWLYIDTWYLIGPFHSDRPGDYSIQHPPETMVDLDGEYPGKDNEPRRWEFYQSNSLRIRPDDERTGATYYGYTEVWFEEGTDMLLAVASDDAARVWINGINVWEDYEISAWRLDEDMRKVYFKPGFNEILVRIESGPGVCLYSVLLCPEEGR